MSEYPSPSPAEIARTNMVESQLRPNRVHNSDLLSAMLNIPREAFLPDQLKPLAYADEGVRVAPGRYMTEPLITARLLDFAQIEAQHRVLIIGGLSPYVAAIASRLAGLVVVIEDNDVIRDIGDAALSRLKIANVSLRAGNLAEDCGDAGPYDIIVIDGAVGDVPTALLDQLAPGGRLVTVEAVTIGNSHGIVIERVGKIFSHRIVFDGFTPYLPGLEPKLHFEFS